MVAPLLHIAGVWWLDWHVHPDVLLVLGALLSGYLYAVYVLRERISDAGRVPRSQVVSFGLGVLVLYAAAGSPIHDLSEHYLLSVHMFQHLLLTLVAPPLLLLGTPAWLWQALFRRPAALAVARVAFHPLVGFGVFNFLLVITHLPGVVDLALREHWFHFLVHAGLVVSAVMMWWPVLSNVPELPRLSYPYQMAYLFVQSLLPAVVASFITFSTSTVYDFYERAPRVWGLTPVEDQQIGALVMKLLGSLIIWGFIVVAFFRWYAHEQAESRDPKWPEVEEERRELGLSGR
ncbi:MAG: cytochrome c oxidase assembly protein [Dehalococcoidia bacterium]|nr:cytochrome c oxidase assembly protein [Dehalococcoidia bacterium]